MKRRFLIAIAVLLPLVLGIVAWRVAEERPKILGHHAQAFDIFLSRNGKRLLSVGIKNNQVWDVNQRQIVGTWDGNFLAFLSSDGERLASVGSRTDAVKGRGETHITGQVYDVRSGETTAFIKERTQQHINVENRVQDVRWSNNTNELQVLTNLSLWRFDARTGRQLARTEIKGFGMLDSCLLSPDGTMIVASGRGGVRWFDAKSGDFVRIWGQSSGERRSRPTLLSVSPDNLYTLTATQKPEPVVRCHRSDNGQVLWEWSMREVGVEGFSSDNQKVYAIGRQHIIARHITTGKEAWRFQAQNTKQAVLSPDNCFVYTLDQNGTIRRWKVPKTS